MSDDRPVSIYSLCDPDTKEVRYVGKTVSSLKERLRGHLKCREGEGHHRVNWIRKLLRDGRQPLIELLETVQAQDNWQVKEQYWIEKLRRDGARLINATLGGEGSHGWQPSMETRRRIAERLRGRKGHPHTEEFKKALALRNSARPRAVWTDARRARWHTMFAGEKNPFYGRKHSEATKQKLREGRVGKLYSEERRKRHRDAMQRPEVRARLGREKLSECEQARLGRLAAEGESMTVLAKEFGIAWATARRYANKTKEMQNR